MNTLHLQRLVTSDSGTLGILRLHEGKTPASRTLFHCCTLELPWQDNAVGTSCIPPGPDEAERTYLIRKCSPARSRFDYWHLHVLDVPGRTAIKMHAANYVYQLRGCIAVGERFALIDDDDQLDVTNSRRTLQRLVALCPNVTTLTVSHMPQEVLPLGMMDYPLAPASY